MPLGLMIVESGSIREEQEVAPKHWLTGCESSPDIKQISAHLRPLHIDVTIYLHS